MRRLSGMEISSGVLVVAVVRLGQTGSRGDRAGHAVAAATAAAELRAVDGEHLDALLAHQGVGVLVALVGDDDTRLEGDDVVAVVPLLPL